MRMAFKCRIADRRFLLLRFCVVDHALEVKKHCRLVSDNPAVVSWRNAYEVTGSRGHLSAIIHLHHHGPRELITEVRGPTALCPGDGLDASGPFPAKLKCSAADYGSGNSEEFKLSPIKLSHLVG